VQEWLSCHLHRVVYKRWTKHAALAGYIPVREPSAYAVAAWRPRGWKWVDPANDAQAAELAIKNGLTTYSALCAEQGGDFYENIDQLAEELEYARSKGVLIGVDAEKALMPPPPEKPAEGDEDENATEEKKAMRLLRGLR
jgi:capsid protein